MTKKILVGYATWSGATHEVANVIASQFNHAGFQTDIVNLKENQDISTYDAFILGTSIHASHPMKIFVEFIKKNHPWLIRKPTALFAVCANMFEDTPENRKETLTWLHDSLKDVPEIPFLDIGLFGGAVLTEGADYEKLNPVIKMVIRSMKKSIVEKMQKDDFRDWDKIKFWTESIITKIKKTS